MTTLRGHHEIKRQTAGYAAFAVATVEMEAIAGPSELHLHAAEGYSNVEAWSSAVAFGLDYAVERAKDFRRFRVTVTLKTTVVDSTSAIVALAVARAALAALDREGEAPPHLEDRSVVFPLG